jgi:copper chaperone CopZ
MTFRRIFVNFKMYLSAVFILLIAIGCASTTKLQKQDIWADLEVRVYEVYGMNCPGCHGGVEKLVNKIPAVYDSEANWEKNKLRVAVRSNSTLDDEEIFEAIRRANFTSGERIM